MLDSSAPTSARTAADGTGSVPGTSRPTAPTGLRERKKQQTRLRIIEVALELCDAQGFDATTVEQIAHAADVSPRTVNRYFESKEDIVLGPVKDFGMAVAEALRELPRGGNELEALRTAFLTVLDEAIGPADTGPIPFRQYQQVRRIMRACPSVSARSLEYADDKNAAIASAVAERLGVAADAPAVRLIVGAWQLIGHVGIECQTEEHAADFAADAAAGRAAFTETFDEFVRLCCPAPPG